MKDGDAAETAMADVVTAKVGRHDGVVTGVAAGVIRGVIIVTVVTDARRTEVVAVTANVLVATRGGRVEEGVEAPRVLR